MILAMKYKKDFSEIELDERKSKSFFDREENQRRLKILLRDGECYPTNVVIHPTMSCNHRCDFCNYFHNLDEENHKEKSRITSTEYIKIEHIIKFFREFEACGVQNLVISGGGDPLLHKDKEIILDTALKYRFEKHIYTNLDFNISDNIIEMLSRFNSININLNTTNPELYRQTRGKGSDLERVIRNVSELKRKKSVVNGVIITRDNTLSSLEQTIEWMRVQNFSSIIVSPAFNIEYKDGEKTTQKTMDSLYKVKKAVRGIDNIRVVTEVEKAVIKDSQAYCRTHYFDITIGADYWVYACCMRSYINGYGIVNLKKFGSFIDGWNSEERRRKLKNVGFKCGDCWFGFANQYLIKREMR